RADVIQPAAYLYQAAMEGAGLPAMVVPEVGLRDGLLWQMVDPLVAPKALSTPDEVVYQMALDIGERYRFDRVHAEQSARLAGKLFDQLAELHRLQPSDRYLLVAAALLHDVGHLVNHGRHHLHTYYLIKNADFYGLSHREQELVAQVAKFHRKGDPDPGRYPEFAALSHQDRVRVTKLTALLRIADALDRTHAATISDVRASQDDGTVTLRVAGPVDINIERWAVAKKAGLFKRVFLTNIAVEPLEG
ncbi:MAG TPA: HD domain-containing protein, partial [bacterium]|nr:HD domain-containing protein [bacterium]